MGRAITLAGFRLTYEEWCALGADARAELLREFTADDVGAPSRDARASYRLLQATPPPAA